MIKINKTQLKDLSDISSTILVKLGKDQPVNVAVLIKICKALKCDIGDILQIVDKDGK